MYHKLPNPHQPMQNYLLAGKAVQEGRLMKLRPQSARACTNFLLISRFSSTSNWTSRSRILMLRETRSSLTCRQSRQKRLSGAVTRSRYSSAVSSSYVAIFCHYITQPVTSSSLYSKSYFNVH